ncbi:MAG: PTS transporter subunit EIIB [Brevinema sp.]
MRYINNTNLCHIGRILFIYLGGVINIRSISNCTSRLRLEIADQELTASDKMILALQSKGVIRFGNDIHIIFNHQAPFLQTKLMAIHFAFKDKISQNIIFLTQNNILKFEQNNQTLTISISKDILLEQKYLKILKDLGCNVEKKINTLIISVPETYKSEYLKYCIKYWELIQSYVITDYIDVNNIKKVVYHKSLYRIVLKEFVSFPSEVWKHYGIQNIYCDPKECEIQFSHHSKELLTLLREHINMEVTKI